MSVRRSLNAAPSHYVGCNYSNSTVAESAATRKRGRSGLGVSGTALAAQLAPGEKGEALGLYNACSSLAGAVGAFLGGSVMAIAGYGTVCAVAVALVALAAVCSGFEEPSCNVRYGIAELLPTRQR
jgi:MFS family permease